MKITFRRCIICSQFHNHLSCPFCGAITLHDKTIDIATGREIVRSKHLHRIAAEQFVVRPLNRVELERIVNRLA